MKVLVDETHGQWNWAETGHEARAVAEAFSGIAEALRRLGIEAVPTQSPLVESTLAGVGGVVLPSPTGRFNEADSSWGEVPETYLTAAEIRDLLLFLRHGGRLLAFSYRFGDRFTKSNLAELFAHLGWVLNSEAVIDISSVERRHPLYTTFTTTAEDQWPELSFSVPTAVQWRPVTTFSAAPICSGFPILFSPASCAAYRFRTFEPTFERQAICVGGVYGSGRYVLVGGPHAFETGEFGLLDHPGNREFLNQVLRWVFLSGSIDEPGTSLGAPATHEQPTSALWERVRSAKLNREKEIALVDFVDDFFQHSTILKRITKLNWSQDGESELDLVYECLSTKLLWSGSRGVVPVECKNWSNKVGAPEITRFAEKVFRTGSKIGLFVARAFTSAAKISAAKARLGHDVIIGLLDDKDFEDYLSGKAEPAKIIEASLVRTMLY